MKKNIINRQSIIEALSIFVILYLMMPCLSSFISLYLSSYLFALVVIVLFFLLINKLTYMHLKLAIPLMGLAFFDLLLDIESKSILLTIYQLILDICPLFLGLYIEKNGSSKAVKTVFYVSIFITLVTTIIGVSQYPDASRYLATTLTNENAAKKTMYSLMNIGGYDFIYTIVLIYPLYIYKLKTKKIKISVFCLYFILSLTAIILSGYTIALLLFLLSSVFLFISGQKTVVRNLLDISVIGICFIVLAVNFNNIINWLSESISNDMIVQRLKILSGGKDSLMTSEDDRLPRYIFSLKSFFGSYCLGTFSNSSIGGHSFILDTSAKYGVLGIVLMAFYYKTMFKIHLKKWQKKDGFVFCLLFFVTVIVLSLINTGMWQYVLGLYTPIMLNTDHQEAQNENIMDS